MNPPINYRLKCVNEDFQVTEVPFVPQLTFNKSSRFTYVWLQKSGFTTFDVLEQLKHFFKLSFGDVRHQGLKDEDAVTEQLISIKKILTNKDVAMFNKKYSLKNQFLRIKHIVGRGKEPLTERMLHGNSFRIVIRNLADAMADDLLYHVSSRRHHYFINYYDNQRFGLPGGPYNSHCIGKAIVEEDWAKAYEQIKVTSNIFPAGRETSRNAASVKKQFKSMNHKKVSFFVSSYNSFL